MMQQHWNRSERRGEFAKRAARISAPPEIENKVREQVAVSVRRAWHFRPGDTVQAVFARELPGLFSFARNLGYVISFDVPEMTPHALARGVLAYTLHPHQLKNTHSSFGEL